MTSRDLGEETFEADLLATYTRDVKRDNYDKVIDRGDSRKLGKVSITAKSLEELKKKLHAHIDLLE